MVSQPCQKFVDMNDTEHLKRVVKRWKNFLVLGSYVYQQLMKTSKK